MSHITSTKNDEKVCLEKTIRVGRLQHGKSLKIIQKLEAPEVDRAFQERPDFMKLVPAESKNSRPTLLGIEHFRVDRLSIKKTNSKVASVGISSEKGIDGLFEKWHGDIQNSTEISEDLASDIARFVANHVQRQEHSSYHTLLESFKYSVASHFNSVDAYRDNLRKTAKNRYKIELAFLIEIHADFYGLFTMDESGFMPVNSTFMPMFEDFVHFIEEQKNLKKIDYILFCIQNAIPADDCKVIVARAQNLRSDLEKQHIHIYEYAGEDYYSVGFDATNKKVKVLPKYEIEKDSLILGTKFENNECNLNDAIRACQRAMLLLNQKKNIIITSAVKGTFEGLKMLGESNDKT